MNFAAIIAWVQLGQQLFERGEQAWEEIKGVLAQHNIAADTAALDAVIADARQRRLRAEAEADDGA